MRTTLQCERCGRRGFAPRPWNPTPGTELVFALADWLLLDRVPLRTLEGSGPLICGRCARYEAP